MSEGKRHPLPASDEARHDEIPEGMQTAKGEGDDRKAPTRPADDKVNPDGETYRA